MTYSESFAACAHHGLTDSGPDGVVGIAADTNPLTLTFDEVALEQYPIAD